MDPIGPALPEAREIRERRRWVVPLGILLVVLGLVAIVAAFAATLATVLFFGVLLLFGGIAQLVHAVGWRSGDFVWELLGADLYLVAGGLLVLDPVSGAVGLTLLLAVFFLVVGALRIALGVRARSTADSGGGLLLSGVLDVALGLLIGIGWPQSSTWVIRLFLGIELVFAGGSFLMLSFARPREHAASGRATHPGTDAAPPG